MRTEKGRGCIKGRSGLATWIPFAELKHASKGLKCLGSIFGSLGLSWTTLWDCPARTTLPLGFHPVHFESSAWLFLVHGPEPAQERCSEKFSFSPPLFPSVNPEQPIRQK